MREVIKKVTYGNIISYEYRTQHYKHYFNEEGIYIYSINVSVKGCSELRIKN